MGRTKQNDRIRTSGGRSNGRRQMRRLIVLAIGGTLLLQPLPLAPFGPAQHAQLVSAAAAQTPTIKLLTENIITSGAVRKDYEWRGTRNGATATTMIHVIEIDLKNPHVRLNAMNGNGGALPGRSSVTSMVQETGAVAGVNADFFDTASSEPVPFGALVSAGELVKSPKQLQGMFMFGVTASGTPVIDRFSFEGKLSVPGGEFPLAGINESAYQTEPDGGYSHVNAMYIYTSAWTASERPNTASSAATPTEALVVDGVVTQVADGATLPMQPPENGYILRGHGTAAAFIRDRLPVGTQVGADYRLKSVTSGRTYDASSFTMMVGGHTILVNEGKPSSFSRSVNSLSPNAARARTAVGYSQDGAKAYLITVEDHGASTGMTLQELQRAMVMLGVYKGMNLDGGGSTTMADRPLGEFGIRLTHPTEDGGGGTYQRPVVNGIGVYTTAPQGELKGIKASGKGVLFIGEQAQYSLKAYDTYYNPLDPSSLTANWSLDKPEIGQISGDILTAQRAGEATLTVKSGAGSDKLPIDVIGAGRIASMTVAAGPARLEAGQTVAAPVKVTLRDGSAYTVPSGLVDWEFRGFTGSVQDGGFRIDSVKEGTTIGYAIARYDGYSTLLALTAGSTSKPFENFENVTYGIASSVVPQGVESGVRLETGLPGREQSKVLTLSYNFAASSEDRTKAAYAMMGEGGVALPDNPLGMTVDVYGDNSRNWLRAAIVDADGKEYLVDLAKAIDWNGWRTVSVDFAASGMKYPVKLKSLYIATIKEGQDERASSGAVAFDNIKLSYAPQARTATNTQIQLTLNRKEAQVNGGQVQLDVAPIALDGVSYLPFRFVADAMGGEVAWDGALKKVTTLRGDRLLEMRVGQSELILNGERRTAAAEPIIRSGRTLVPLRLVSEQLGLTVDYDDKTKKITIFQG